VDLHGAGRKLGHFWGKCRYIFQHHGASGFYVSAVLLAKIEKGWFGTND
jgi:hypothetical protein